MKQFIQGFMNIDELRRLQDWASQYESVVEVGSWKGQSTCAMCTVCPGKVYAVDHFRGSKSLEDGTNPIHKQAQGDVYSQFLENTKDFKNLEVLKMDSLEAAKQFEPRSVDMIFIDASHEY
jgi:predicted O-methyltransferase YrrM